MKKNLKTFFSVLFLTTLLILPYFVFADASTANPSLTKLIEVAEQGGYKEQSLAVIVGTVISAALSLLGGIFLILIIIGGYDWMTAEGNEQKVEKAQNYIRRAMIGLAITLSSWAIWRFIFDRFINN